MSTENVPFNYDRHTHSDGCLIHYLIDGCDELPQMPGYGAPHRVKRFDSHQSLCTWILHLQQRFPSLQVRSTQPVPNGSCPDWATTLEHGDTVSFSDGFHTFDLTFYVLRQDSAITFMLRPTQER